MKAIRKGQKVGCNGEGDSVYRVDLVDRELKFAYLKAYGNTCVDAGWKSFSQLREIKSIKKSKIVVYDVEFEQ